MWCCKVDLTPFLIKIWDATAGELKHLRRPKPRIEELKEAITELSAKEEDVNNRIRLAELQGEIPTKQVELWGKAVEELKGKAAATEQDFESRRCLCGWSWNCFSVNRRVAKRMEEMNKLMTRSDATPVSMKSLPSAVVELPISDSKFVMEAYKSEILGYIASPNAIEVIGIYGMGGAGKTTLLKSINNHRDIATKFDLVIWAVASRECKMEKLQMDIADRLGLNLKQHEREERREETRAIQLYDFLKNKNCLLLLDDLWKSVDLAMLGMVNRYINHPVDLAMLDMVNAHANRGEKLERKVVVFTTRDKEVCDRMWARKQLQIKCLEQKEAWLLFQSKASDAIESDPGIEHIARQIVEECAGLPLALITVGVALSSKKWESWNEALTLMKESQILQVTLKKDEDLRFSAFKLSYDMLQDDEMRGCLLSCALWPEDHSINKEELIECWMGLGLINEEGEIHKTYNKGYSHIETLKAACLLEPGNDEEREVKMHDVIRDMALWMASDCGKKKFKWIVRAGVAASRGLEEDGWYEAERVSLMYNDIASLPHQLPTCSKLSVLMLQCNEELKEVRGTLIQAMRSLTYLDLNNTGIVEIPNEISMISQLQHLNLSNTRIKGLPAEMGNLINLKYLFLRGTHYLTLVAKGAISKLTLLRLLDLRGSFLVLFSVCWDELEGLKGCPKSSIGIEIMIIDDTHTLQRLYSLQNVSIWRLDVSSYLYSPNLNQLLDNIMKIPSTRQSMEQLNIQLLEPKELLISKGNEEITWKGVQPQITWNEETGRLESLKFLSISVHNKLEEITWKGVQPQIVFRNLRELRIAFCRNLKNVNWVFQLPSLIVLDISYCDEMVELASDESSVRLRRIRLFDMHKLERISRRPLYFPNLEKIEVQNCPLIKKLPSFGNTLKVMKCEQGWWDNLEWEDISIKTSLWPLVALGRNPVPLAVEQIATSISKVGMEECKAIILGHITSANAGVIGVYGMAGVGKTTLLRSIKNNVKTKFDRVILAVATKDCKMERLQRDISKELLCTLEEDETEKDRSTKLLNSMEDQDCLLLLDDLSALLDLRMLGMPRVTLRQRKQKRKVVVFTTRNEQVCSDMIHMNAGMRIEIKCLEPEQAWELFRRNTGEDAIKSDAKIENMAHKIAEECAGLPLALSIIGKAMSTKKSSEAWNDALTQMKQLQMLEITGEKEASLLFSASKISYDSLEDDDMRARLLSCALWPGYHSIKKDELIECWMGLGLIDVEGTIHEIYNRGHSHIEILKAAFLLEPGNDEEREIKMNDVIRDMALWMANDCGKKKFKWIRSAGVAASRALQEEGWHEAERVSLMYNDIESLPKQLSTCSKLSVLMLQCNKELKEIGGTLIQVMRFLTYLDLKETGIKEIPKEIRMLSQLQHLNLSCTLIQELPAELGNLVNLKYLFLRYTGSLTAVAKGAISNLSLLRWLDLRGSSLVYCSVCWDELEGLKGCPKPSIRIDIRTTVALQSLCSLQNVSIWQLKVNLTDDPFSLNQLLDDIMKSRNTREGMEQLKINRSKSKELLISKGNEEVGGFECLNYLELHLLYQLEEITWKGLLPQKVFPNLQELTISHCNSLKNVNWALPLPSLRVLKISCCSAMEELISDEGILDSLSFGLRRMTLISMDKLKWISRRPLCFPYLEEIKVRECYYLIKLSFPMNKLKVIQCEQVWWNNLEWKYWWDKLEWEEDVSMKNSLSPFVVFRRSGTISSGRIGWTNWSRRMSA